MNSDSSAIATTRAKSRIKSQLQCLRDLVALSALPSMWIELAPTTVAENLADVLFRIVHADLIYIRMKISTAGAVYEAVRTSCNPHGLHGPETMRNAFAPWFERKFPVPPMTISNP